MKANRTFAALLLILAVITACQASTTEATTEVTTEAHTEVTTEAVTAITTTITPPDETTVHSESTVDSTGPTAESTSHGPEDSTTDASSGTTLEVTVESTGTTDEEATTLDATASDSTSHRSTDALTDGLTSSTEQALSTGTQGQGSTSEKPTSASTLQETQGPSSTQGQGSTSEKPTSASTLQETEGPSSTQGQGSTSEKPTSASTLQESEGPSSTQGQGSTSESSTGSPPPTLEPEVSYVVATAYGRMNGKTYTVRVSPFSDATFTTKRVSRFLGMPYALPPVQSRRFKSPVKVPTGGAAEVNATEHKPNCPQHGQAYDEDCLYYNVWTVQTAENANASLRYPVLVWIHGGRFETGYSSDPLRQGEELVTHNNVVVVSFNYRLGALGFLTLGRTNYTGNYGIQDQKVAIEVISEVIGSFGGNQSQITLMGLDAGSASIGFHMMSSSTSALFSRAIMMGGSPMMPWSLTNDLEYVQLLGLLFITGGLNCSMSEPALTQCLQSVPISRLISLQSNFTRFFQGLEFSPVVDGSTIPQDPWHAFSTGNFHSKDLLIGSTNDEGANIAEDSLEALNIPILGVNDSMLVSLIERSIAFYPRASRTLSAAGRQFLRLHFTGHTGANDGKANFGTLGKAIGDWYLTCPVIQMAQFAEKLNQNVYLYYFTEKELSQDKWEASHGVDADYAFGVPTLSTGIIYPDVNKRLSERMMENFVQFAAEGKPTGADLWKPLNNTRFSEMNYINYNANARILGNYQRGYRMTECHFWNKTLAYVNDLERPSITTTTTTATPAPTTPTRPPIGPSCGEWTFNSATATTMGVLLASQVVMAAALGFVLYKWKSLAKVGSEAIPMN